MVVSRQTSPSSSCESHRGASSGLLSPSSSTRAPWSWAAGGGSATPPPSAGDERAEPEEEVFQDCEGAPPADTAQKGRRWHVLRRVLLLPVLLPVRAGRGVANGVACGYRRRQMRQRQCLQQQVPLLRQHQSAERRCRRDTFHEHRMRAWKAPLNALETLEPYGYVSVHVAEARGLAPLPPASLGPFVEMFVNDELAHRGQRMPPAGGAAAGGEAAMLGVHSPLSIVRVALMDESMSDGFLGFVEFKVADLVPNAGPVSGWFELRHPSRLLGTGRARFRTHARARDEHSGRAGNANAGEVHLSLRFAASDRLGDEWYAFCFPRPCFTIFHRFAEVDDKVNTLDVMDLFRDIVAIWRLAWEHCIRHIISASTYITSWQCPPLSCLVFGWWLAVGQDPRWLFPTLPLWVALWLRLLRTPAWRKCILAHEATAPLSAEGFAMVAHMDDSRRLAFWLERVVRDQGGQVLDLRQIRKCASLVYRDRKPCLGFDDLLDFLRNQTCIQWPAHAQPLNADGFRNIRDQRSAGRATAWLMQVVENLQGNVQDHGSLQRFAAQHCIRGGGGATDAAAAVVTSYDELVLQLRKQPWITWRSDTMWGEGEEGAASSGGGWWGQVPSWIIPRPVERLTYRIANPVDDLRNQLNNLYRFGSRALEAEERALARGIYRKCALWSAASGLFTYFLDADLNSILWTILGVAAATHRLPVVRQLVTTRRANLDMAVCQAKRLEGGCRNWAFFKPDD